MIDALATALIVVALAYAAFALVTAAAGRAPREYFVIASGAVELVVLVQVVIAVVLLVGGDRPDELGTFVLYLIVSVIILPVGTLWALAERSRWGPAVLGVACLALVVVVVRLTDLWSTVGG
ncbi:MAG: hypothetical protein ACRDWI_19900 [Jiangellaceae bacterium]